ncbi:hypothetical protein JYQ62_05260 [Nostoc sp. UHCC 0702]|nr:hypothetical protein JYQ62_05260 [Nostoc sp. UHCC 0702]
MIICEFGSLWLLNYSVPQVKIAPYIGFNMVGCVVDASPNAPIIIDGALRYAATHPTTTVYHKSKNCTLHWLEYDGSGATRLK